MPNTSPALATTFLVVEGRGMKGNAKSGKKRFMFERMRLGDEPVTRMRNLIGREYEIMFGEPPSNLWLKKGVRDLLNIAGRFLRQADHVELTCGSMSFHFVSSAS